MQQKNQFNLNTIIKENVIPYGPHFELKLERKAGCND